MTGQMEEKDEKEEKKRGWEEGGEGRRMGRRRGRRKIFAAGWTGDIEGSIRGPRGTKK